MTIEKILPILINSKKRLEGQRLKEKWFLKRGYTEEYNFLKNKNITDTKSLYMYITGETDRCECGSLRRFISYKDGFKQHCEKCARTKFNHMKKLSEFNFAKKDLKFELRKFLKNDIKKLKTGEKYSSTKIVMNPKIIQKVIESTHYLDKDVKINERLYHIEHDIKEVQVCINCGIPLDNFISTQVGYYSDYCKKNKCAIKFKDTSTISKGIKHSKYPMLVSKFKNAISKLSHDDEYQYNLFTEEEYLNDSAKIKIKHKCGYEYDIDIGYQGHFKCPKCFPIRSKKQYEIYEFLREYTDIKFNDRKLIRPLELDILTDKFAIEYDSLTFHSTGNSALQYLNFKAEKPNKHVYKTELCENKSVQLFRIFSNEWFQKQDIWKSIILHRLGISSKIFARKCEINEIDTKTSKEFLQNNHLQGSINASVRIGLFYKNNLVQVMTFCKSRFNKKYQYELLRMCSKLDYTVIGGASKLLKYFERNYKPDSIISYANRRWSQGNVYKILGFEFIHNSKPNYFYFKGDDCSSLFSRNQFQKHLLKNKLTIFKPELTETENMYLNGYRKIYDCGDKVYVKEYINT